MIENVKILKRKLLRVVLNLPYTEHTISFFKSNLILKLDDLYEFNVSISKFNHMKNSINHRDFISISIVIIEHTMNNKMK